MLEVMINAGQRIKKGDEVNLSYIMKYDNSLEKVKVSWGSYDKAFSNSKTVKARKVDSLRTLQEKNGNICNSDIVSLVGQTFWSNWFCFQFLFDVSISLSSSYLLLSIYQVPISCHKIRPWLYHFNVALTHPYEDGLLLI